MVEAEGASRSLFNKGYRYLFAVLSTSEQYLASAVALAAEMAEAGGKPASSVKVAVAVENDPFSLDIRAGVLEDSAKFDMKIVVDEQLPRDLSDMSAILTKVKLLKPDLLIVSGHSKGAATAVRQIDEQNIQVPMIAITHCEAADVVGKFGDAANDILCSTQWAETLTYSDSIFGTAAEYEQDFRSTIRSTRTSPFPTRRPRRPPRSTSSRMRSSAPARWTRKPCVTRLRKPTCPRSTARSGFPRPATTSPSRWCCGRSRAASTTWWRLPRSPRTRSTAAHALTLPGAKPRPPGFGFTPFHFIDLHCAWNKPFPHPSGARPRRRAPRAPTIPRSGIAKRPPQRSPPATNGRWTGRGGWTRSFPISCCCSNSPSST